MKTCEALFKIRPSGELDMLGATIEQVTPIITTTKGNQQ